MPTALQYVYTSRDEVERIYGDKGVTLNMADLKGSDIELYWTEVISEATDTINLYCVQFYDEIDLASSYWVRRKATWIAAYLHSQRRGNASLFVQRFQEVMEELMAIQQGLLQIPGLATRSDLTPALSNFTIDDRFYTNKIRVLPSISVGGTNSRQDLAYRWPYDWL